MIFGRSKLKHTTILAAALLLASGLVFAFHIYKKEAVKNRDEHPELAFPEQNRLSFLKIRNYFLFRIDQVGADQTYAELKIRYKDQHFNFRHLAAHIAGEVLYEKFGAMGITVCDHTFGDFGCYHGLTIAAIQEEGTGAVLSLHRACHERLPSLDLQSSCDHGIGHGILQYTENTGLAEALDLCRFLPENAATQACARGLFMQYNVATNVTHDAAETRLRNFDTADPYTPCPSVSAEFQESCYFQLPQWWDKILAKDYAAIGKLCDAVSRDDLRNACFRGTGNVAAPSSDYNAAETVRKCGALPRIDGEVFCRATAAQQFLSLPHLKTFATILCADLKPELQQSCILFAGL